MPQELQLSCEICEIFFHEQLSFSGTPYTTLSPPPQKLQLQKWPTSWITTALALAEAQQRLDTKKGSQCNTFNMHYTVKEFTHSSLIQNCHWMKRFSIFWLKQPFFAVSDLQFCSIRTASHRPEIMDVFSIAETYKMISKVALKCHLASFQHRNKDNKTRWVFSALRTLTCSLWQCECNGFSVHHLSLDY